jgi:hypothetical protein
MNAVVPIRTAIPPRTSASSSFSVSSLSSMLVVGPVEGKPHRFAGPTLAVSESATATRDVSGQRIVIGIYLALVVFAGVMGLILGFMIDDLESVALLGVIPIPPTPFGLALYGSVTIALVLGVFLVAVRYVAPED